MIGLDIGTNSIKAVQLDKGGQGHTLIAAGITVAPAPISSDLDADLGKVAESIKKLLTDAKMTVRQANVSLPESQAFTRLISLPYLTDEEVSSAISWQAEPYIPIPISEAAIDYQIVSRNKPQSNFAGSVDVLLVAASKSAVNKYVKVCELAGLAVSTVETELLALSRSIAPQKGAVLILDLGATSTDLAVVRDGQLLMSRSIATAGEVLTRAVASNLSVGKAQAEEYKKTYGLSAELEGKVRQAIEPALVIIVDEMKKAIQYYKNELKGQDEIGAAILAGGSSGMAELVPYLAEKVGFEVTIGNPFSKLLRSENVTKSLAAYAPLYSAAVGLALNS